MLKASMQAMAASTQTKWTGGVSTGSGLEPPVLPGPGARMRFKNLAVDQRPGRSLITFCIARAQMMVIYADQQPSRSPFTMGTRRWRPLRAQTRLPGMAETLNAAARDRYQGARRA